MREKKYFYFQNFYTHNIHLHKYQFNIIYSNELYEIHCVTNLGRQAIFTAILLFTAFS